MRKGKGNSRNSNSTHLLLKSSENKGKRSEIKEWRRLGPSTMPGNLPFSKIYKCVIWVVFLNLKHDFFRRSQVEERRRQMWEAVQERREAIMKKHQERKARIETKAKNERSQIVFAFGSSTPRMLEPADTGGSTYWGTRRATSTTNVMMFSAAQPLTRRSSERELDGSKKRATSAGGLDRKPGEGRLEISKISSKITLFYLTLFLKNKISSLKFHTVIFLYVVARNIP